ncbi:hypothetical protein SLITK23_29770 [Streptomyces lividans]|uniref:Translation initiation factor IF-2 n=2 Tax=Streptomyces TaxID=1883 RepID=A0ABM5R4X6_STRLI|nr:hypothetical protein SLIV_22885 [Streptomyces lividans TK24]QSJ11075.1 hypothetical protein SLIVDG2_22885 [Streptomyces lividans]QTD71985.1 hypothetical protein SLIVYQS_22885 [Streptomyces lividans TK24] [Streptomyces lividans]BDE39732.1 hypothetical protein SLITK23_29770 [Streptomyces lividans]
MGAGSADECSESYAHPEVFRGGKCARVKNWQKDAQPEWPEVESGARDLSEAGRDADATEVLPPARAFPPAGGPPMTAPGPGWFGESGESPRGRGSSDADRTQILGSRIGGRAPREQRPDPMAQGRITWGTTDRPGANHGNAAPAPGTGHTPGTGTGPDPDRTDVLPSAGPAAPAPLTRAFPAPASAPAPLPVPPPPGPATAALRDPWQETPDTDGDPGTGTGAAGHTHDPHEVTVQLDAVHLGDGVLLRADSGHRKRGPEASDGPVFVDASGRRSRLYRRLGILVGIACAVYAVVIVSTLLSGNSDAPWMPVPGQEEGAPAGQVDTTPAPSQSAQPSGTGNATTPQATPSADAGVTTEPGVEAPASGTSGVPGGSTGQPGTSAGPESSAAGSGQNPGGSGATGPDPTQSTEVPPSTGTDPSAPTGGGAPSGDPTQPTGGSTTDTDPGAGGTNANGAGAPDPVAGPAGASVVVAEPAAGSSTPPSLPLSPENTL